MAALAPLHELCFRLRCRILAGDSMMMAVEHYCSTQTTLEAQDLRKILWLMRGGQNYSPDPGLSPLRQLLYQLIAEGLRGKSTGDLLAKLEKEIAESSRAEVDAFIKALPLKVTLVLMGLCVPAVLILFFSLFLQIFFADGGML